MAIKCIQQHYSQTRSDVSKSYDLGLSISCLVCLLRWARNECLDNSTLGQISHACCRLRWELCLAMTWRLRPSFWRNFTPQSLHVNGFSPVSRLRKTQIFNKCCIRMKRALTKVLLHKLATQEISITYVDACEMWVICSAWMPYCIVCTGKAARLYE